MRSRVRSEGVCMGRKGKTREVNIYSGGPRPTDIPDLDLASFTLARASQLGR